MVITNSTYTKKYYLQLVKTMLIMQKKWVRSSK